MRMLVIGLIAFIVVVVAGQVYMTATRPDVPAMVSATLDTYAPGVTLGASVPSVRKTITNLRFVPHVGFVGTNTGTGRAGLFPQVRLLLAPEWRVKVASRAEQAPIDAVELVTARSGAYGDLVPVLAGMFRTAPRDGCIRTSTPGNYREVQYWTSRTDRGGVALVRDWGRNADVAHPGQAVLSLVVFKGPFQGGSTLRGDFVAANCLQVSGDRP